MIKDRKEIKIRFNDVTLRESGQVHGGAMTPEDQLTYVQFLLEGGIDQIEIGFPGSSHGQMIQCQRVVDFVGRWDGEKPLLSGLARAVRADIDAVKNAGCDVCHIYIPSSDNLMLAQFDSAKYGTDAESKRKWVIQQAVEMVRYAKSLGFEMIEYSPEDAARTSKEYLCKIVEAVINAGADIINIPDTTGLRVGNEFGDLTKCLFANVANIKQAIVSVHCHNDSDHSTHNALQAILNGATQLEGTFYGLGERSGMTKFEAVLMNIQTRRDIFGDFGVNFDSKLCVKIVNFVANALGMPVPRHWPVVGSQNGFVSSGTHQDIEVKTQRQGKDSAYYGWEPMLYGHGEVAIVFNQSSGKAGLAAKLETLGYKLSSEHLEKVYLQAKKISEARAGDSVSDIELAAIVQDVVTQIPYFIEVKRCQAIGGAGTLPTATIIIEYNGVAAVDAEGGNGPYDAIMKAVKSAAGKIFPELAGVEITLEEWKPVSVGGGSETLADVYARIRIVNGDDLVFVGRAVHVDTNQASAQAFANCLSWYLAYVKEEKNGK